MKTVNLNGVYVLELKKSKYYVGSCASDEYGMRKRIIDHLEPLNFSTEDSANWVKKHGIERVHNIISTSCSDTGKLLELENEVTKIYMIKFGWQNVRGGNYCHLDSEENSKPPSVFTKEYMCGYL